LFLNASNFFGQTGSGWHLVPINRNLSETVLIGHDQSQDWRGLAWAIQENVGKVPKFILGLRDLPLPGNSEPIYHQDFRLEEVQLAFLNSLLLERP
jgi:hypothetical protein